MFNEQSKLKLRNAVKDAMDDVLKEGLEEAINDMPQDALRDGIASALREILKSAFSDALGHVLGYVPEKQLNQAIEDLAFEAVEQEKVLDKPQTNNDGLTAEQRILDAKQLAKREVDKLRWGNGGTLGYSIDRNWR